MKLGRILKRSVDVLVGAVLAILLLPLVAIAALLVLVLEGWPVFYISRRFVARGKDVALVKLRTMVRDARSPVYRLEERFMRDGYLDVPISCEVYTPIGRMLERTQLVEVPQLLNVLGGSMSLIGNRPLPARNLELLSVFEGWDRRFNSPAGITGIAQVVGKHYLQPADRVQLESAYSDAYQTGNIILVDLKIAYHTIRLLLTGKFLDLDEAYAMMGQERRVMATTRPIGVVESTSTPSPGRAVPVVERISGPEAASRGAETRAGARPELKPKQHAAG